MRKNDTAWQATDDNLAQEHCVLAIKATATHSEYVMQYLTDFPRQQYLRGRASKLLFYVSIGLELPVHNSKQHFFISPSEIINSLHVIFHMTNGSYHTNLKTFK